MATSNSPLSTLREETVDIGVEIYNSFVTMLSGFVQWLPRVVGAVIVILIGMFVAKVVKGLVAKLLNKIQLDKVISKGGVNMLMKTSGISMTTSNIILALIYWIILLVFFSSAANVLGIESITNFVDLLIGYIPAIIAGLIIMVIGALAANAVSDILDKIDHGRAYKTVVRWVILIIAFITAVEQLGFNLNFLTENLTIIVGGIMLALGLAFGLGGKDKAKEFVDKFFK